MRTIIFFSILSITYSVFGMYTPEHIEQIKGLGWAVEIDDYVLFDREVKKIEDAGLQIDVTPVCEKILQKIPSSALWFWLESAGFGSAGFLGLSTWINRKECSSDQLMNTGIITFFTLLVAFSADEIRKSCEDDRELYEKMMARMVRSKSCVFKAKKSMIRNKANN